MCLFGLCTVEDKRADNFCILEYLTGCTFVIQYSYTNYAGDISIIFWLDNSQIYTIFKSQIQKSHFNVIILFIITWSDKWS